jgi:hypothetical protein
MRRCLKLSPSVEPAVIARVLENLGYVSGSETSRIKVVHEATLSDFEALCQEEPQEALRKLACNLGTQVLLYLSETQKKPGYTAEELSSLYSSTTLFLAVARVLGKPDDVQQEDFDKFREQLERFEAWCRQ